MWQGLASGLYLMDYLRDYLMDYFMDYLEDYLRLVEPLALLAALSVTKAP